MIFFRISRQIPEKSDVCSFSIKFAKTNQKIAENSEICENYSILFNRVLNDEPPKLAAELDAAGWRLACSHPVVPQQGLRP